MQIKKSEWEEMKMTVTILSAQVNALNDYHNTKKHPIAFVDDYDIPNLELCEGHIPVTVSTIDVEDVTLVELARYVLDRKSIMRKYKPEIEVEYH